MSDVVVKGREVPADVRRSMELWVGCVAGALEEDSYREKLARAGFEAVDVEPTRVYQVADAKQFLTEAGITDERRARADRRPIHERVRPRAEAAIDGGRKGMLLVHVLRLRRRDIQR